MQTISMQVCRSAEPVGSDTEHARFRSQKFFWLAECERACRHGLAGARGHAESDGERRDVPDGVTWRPWSRRREYRTRKTATGVDLDGIRAKGPDRDDPTPWRNGSPGRTRTSDMVVNSHPLYQLSYRGSGTRPRPDTLLYSNRILVLPALNGGGSPIARSRRAMQSCNGRYARRDTVRILGQQAVFPRFRGGSRRNSCFHH